MNRRRWIPHRQAYFPRLWPQLAVVIPVTMAIVNLLPWGLGNVAFSTAATLVITLGRFVIWRRRHPIVTAYEYRARMCEKAMWN